MTIYFIQQGRNGPVKIGIATDPKKRLSSLQTGCSESLHILGTMRGGSSDERNLHDKFQAHRVRGEWFKPAGELLAYIDNTAEKDKDTWLSLVAVEPRLLDLLMEAQEVCDDYTHSYFCTNWRWYKVGGLKDRLCELVGWTAENGAQRLRTMEAYDLAYKTIYDALPDCRGDCPCFGS